MNKAEVSAIRRALRAHKGYGVKRDLSGKAHTECQCGERLCSSNHPADEIRRFFEEHQDKIIEEAYDNPEFEVMVPLREIERMAMAMFQADPYRIRTATWDGMTEDSRQAYIRMAEAAVEEAAFDRATDRAIRERLGLDK